MEIIQSEKYMKLKVLDRRNKGWGKFLYYATTEQGTPIVHQVDTFNQWRVWCWEHWGSSCELEAHRRGPAWSNSRWCWSYEPEITYRIYITSYDDVTAFSFRWL
jgi:hypothetical protein